jgi:hypothetical protein
MKTQLRHLPLCILFCVVVTIAFAKTKEHPDSDYQDGVLVSFRTAAAGSNCSSSGSVKGSVNDSGDVEGGTDSSGSCHDLSVRLYTIRVGDSTFVIKHAPENWNRQSVLEGQLPGFRFKIRTQKDKLYIKVGERESPFSLLEAK